jgi:hypothetical protein
MARTHRTEVRSVEVHIHGRSCDRCGIFASAEEVGGMAGFMARGWESMRQAQRGTELDFCPECSADVASAVDTARARPPR